MKLITVSFAFLLFCLISSAQTFVNKVIVLNEGHYDYTNQVQTIPVSIGSYDPATHAYSQFDVITNARFATHVITDGNSIYAAVDSFIIRYDINTYQLQAITTLRGVRKLAVWNNQLLASRGEYLVNFNSYFSVFDKNTLMPVYSLPVTSGPQYASEGIVVSNNKAYIAINNGFEFGNEKGLIGIVDLPAQTYLSEIDLGPAGKNPEYISLLNNQLFTVNNRDYTAASVSAVDISSSGVTTVDLGITSGCGGSVLAGNEIFYQPSAASQLGKFNTQTMSNSGTLSINKNIYGMAHDYVNNLIYAGETDFTSWGKIFIYQPDGTLVDSFNVSAAPGNIAFDIRSAASVAENNLENNFSVYPNPAGNELSVVSSRLSVERVEVFDTLGEKIYSSSPEQQTTNNYQLTIDVSKLNRGIYFLSVTTSKKTFNERFIKQ